jgi:hypothetical protein
VKPECLICSGIGSAEPAYRTFIFIGVFSESGSKGSKVLFFPANYPLFFTAGRPIISVFGGICLFLHANLSRETYVEFFLAGASRR